jgi:hypothetical protein
MKQTVILESVYDWLAYGVDHGFCSEVVCGTHDGLPYTDEESEEWDEGLDPCVHVVRMYAPD